MQLARVASILVFSGAAYAVLALGSYADGNRSLFVAPRNIAMGTAAGAITADPLPTSSPAGLVLDTASRVALSYAGWYANALSSSTAAFARPITSGTAVGVSLAYLHIPDIHYNAESEIITTGSADTIINLRTRTVTASEVFLTVSGAHRFTVKKRISIDAGAALHGQRRNLPEEDGSSFTGYGIGLDAGLAVSEKKSGFRAGLYAQDLTTDYIRWTSSYSEQAKPKLYAEISISPEIPYVYGSFALCLRTADLLDSDAWSTVADNPEAYGIDTSSFLKRIPAIAIGAEYTIAKAVSIRVGMSEQKRISFGAGLALFQRHLLVDMAYDLPRGLPGTYVLAAGWRW